MTLLAGATLVPASATTAAAPLGYVGVGTEMAFSASGMNISLPLIATCGLDPVPVLLTVDLTALGREIDAALADLASLLGGRSFTNELDGVPLGLPLTLKALLVQVDLVNKAASSVRVVGRGAGRRPGVVGLPTKASHRR